MADGQQQRRLYVLAGVAVTGSVNEIMLGCLLANNEHEATGHHVAWMQRQKPGSMIHSVTTFPLPDDLVRQAARELGDG